VARKTYLQRRHKSPGWFRSGLRFVFSWFSSAAVHAGLLFLLIFISQFKSSLSDYPGNGGDSFGPVVEFVGPGGGLPAWGQGDGNEGSSDSDTAGPVVFESRPLGSEEMVRDVLAQPPAALTLPTGASPSYVGIGTPPSLDSATVAGILSPSAGGRGRAGSGSGLAGGGGTGTGGSGGGSGGGHGSGEGRGTSLFGATDTGKKYVYVIDRSFSMDSSGSGPAPLSVAKDELTASLQRLDEFQQFQIIFYNSDGQFVLESSTGASDYFWGTDTQRLSAVRQFRLVQPSGGTDHVPALERALQFEPDVVFFLTDGQEPQVTSAELQRIRRLNRRARIHCIEFGEGTRITGQDGIDPGNWLQKLALDNGGQYVYRDVRRFGR
jgi:Ca-activated chloride channel family protein